ncbi:MAG: hypothetical protein JO353_01210 [Phycisphaerae bacterium]|nr:hypothetical protein [Phycisphaerae bacterium]
MIPQLRIDSPQWLLPAVALWLIVAIGLLWIERERIRGVRWLGLGARVLAAGALLLALCKPTLVRAVHAGQSWELILLVDQSHSMSVPDPQRPLADCVAIADTLQVLPEKSRPIVAADLRMAVDESASLFDAIDTAQSELDYAQLSGHGGSAAESRVRAAFAALRAKLSSLQTASSGRPNAGRLFSICREGVSLIDRKTSGSSGDPASLRQRLRGIPLALANAASDPQQASDALLYQNDTAVRAAADQIKTMPRIELVRRLIIRLRSKLSRDLKLTILGADPTLPPLKMPSERTSIDAEGEKSDLGGALAALHGRLAGRPVQGIVLFSDGRQVNPSNSGASADVPLMTIDPAAPVRSDISLAQVDAPSWTYLHESTTLRVVVQAMGMRDQPVDLTVEINGIPQTKHVMISEGRSVYRFSVRFDSPGLSVMTVHVSMSPSYSMEQNNRISRMIRVYDAKAKVMLICGDAGSDLDALQNALRGSPWIAITEAPSTTQPAEFDKDWLDDQRLVILHDVRTDLLAEPQWQQLANWVQFRGGGVIFIAGPQSNAAATQEVVGLRRLLPWRENAPPPQWRNRPAEAAGFHLLPSDASPLTRLSADALDNRRRWEQLPALHDIFSIQMLRQNTVPVLTDQESGQAIITDARLGAGRVLFIGTNQTDRWRGKLSADDPDRFWLGAIHEIAGRPFAVHTASAGLDVDQAQISPGQSCTVRTRGKNANAVDVLRDGEPVTRLVLNPMTQTNEEGRYAGNIPPLPIGDYQVRLQSAGTLLTMPLAVVPNFDAEMANLTPDDSFLRRIARSSGGDELRLDEVMSLPQRLQQIHQGSPTIQTFPLWDSAALYGFVVGCLCFEWASRKWIGLV